MAYYHYRFGQRIDANTTGIYSPNQTRLLMIDEATANYITTRGGLATNKGLVIIPNSADTYPKLTMLGNDTVYFNLKTGKELGVRIEGTDLFYIYMAVAGSSTLESKSGNDLYLKTAGGGYVKFGTTTGTGDVACNGHLDIKDSAGNVVKLMTCA